MSTNNYNTGPNPSDGGSDGGGGVFAMIALAGALFSFWSLFQSEPVTTLLIGFYTIVALVLLGSAQFALRQWVVSIALGLSIVAAIAVYPLVFRFELLPFWALAAPMLLLLAIALVAGLWGAIGLWLRLAAFAAALALGATLWLQLN